MATSCQTDRAVENLDIEMFSEEGGDISTSRYLTVVVVVQ
jgi:hypothetical protein